MASVGYTNCTTYSGASGWTDPTNIYTDNSAFTYASVAASGYTSYFYCKGYGFSIPSGATILGIQVRLSAKKLGSSQASANIRFNNVYLLDTAGAIAGSFKTSGYFTTTDSWFYLGAVDDLWGNALTPAWVNDADFGLTFRCYNGGTKSAFAHVDSAQIGITYELSSGIIVTVWG